MKAKDVYGALREQLEPWCKANGFRRGRSMLSWSRALGEEHLLFWCQVSRDGWDPFAGSKFTVAFQRAAEPVVGIGRHRRIAGLLDEEGREEVRTIQNAVIGSLVMPPRSYGVFSLSPEVTAWYLAKFDLLTQPLDRRDDVWLRYAAPDHVVAWGQLILRKLPACIATIEGWNKAGSERPL